MLASEQMVFWSDIRWLMYGVVPDHDPNQFRCYKLVSGGPIGRIFTALSS